jgi:hypothetical protein
LRCHAALAPFKGLAVQTAGGKFQPYEYEPKPLGPTEIEIKVRMQVQGLAMMIRHQR